MTAGWLANSEASASACCIAASARKPGVNFSGEIRTRRLQNLISAAELPVFPFQFRDPLLILRRGSRLRPALAALAAIVFLIAAGLIDVGGMRRILACRHREFTIALRLLRVELRQAVTVPDWSICVGAYSLPGSLPRH